MKVALSILTVDYKDVSGSLKSYAKDCDYIHMDVMDGVFVPNISFGPAFVSSLNKDELLKDIPFDTHLMVTYPQNYIKQFAEAGSDYITFHVEASCVPSDVIYLIHEYGKKAGISIKPNTPVKSIKKYLADLDMVLVMSVEPGFGGQKFMPQAIEKVKELKKLKEENGYHYLINIDGGINDVTGKEIAEYVDLAVSGSFVCNSSNPKEAIKKLHSL